MTPPRAVSRTVGGTVPPTRSRIRPSAPNPRPRRQISPTTSNPACVLHWIQASRPSNPQIDTRKPSFATAFPVHWACSVPRVRVTRGVVPPVLRLALQTILVPALQTTLQPILQPIVQPVLQLVFHSILQPIVQTILHRILQPVVQSIDESVVQTVVEPGDQYIVHLIVQPVVSSVVQTEVQSVPQSDLDLHRRFPVRRRLEPLSLSLQPSRQPRA